MKLLLDDKTTRGYNLNANEACIFRTRMVRQLSRTRHRYAFRHVSRNRT